MRAMVGGCSYARSKFNRAWQAERQIGSTVKAFVYGTAFEQGMTPATLVNDIPTRFVDPVMFRRGQGPDGRLDARPARPGAIVRAQELRAGQLGPDPHLGGAPGRQAATCPPLRTLDEVGIGHVRDFAAKVGVTGTMPPYPSLALGAADLPLNDMVRAYATFANNGQGAVPPFLIKKVVDRNGRVLETHEGVLGEEVVDPKVNFELIQCLQGVATQGTGARTNGLNWPVAGKTGTPTNTPTPGSGLHHPHHLRRLGGPGREEDHLPRRRCCQGGGAPSGPISRRSPSREPPGGDFRLRKAWRAARSTATRGWWPAARPRIQGAQPGLPPGSTAPSRRAPPEAIARIRGARDKAHNAVAEVRVWGKGRPKEDGDAPIDWNKMMEPPKVEAAKPEARTEAKPDAKPEVKPEAKPDHRAVPEKVEPRKTGPQKSW
ncbi:MAG: hypothetical protein IPL96_17885 [Holophagaceae bacterium]|nr:hypothetical protein [Holophagaceae bacterium]